MISGFYCKFAPKAIIMSPIFKRKSETSILMIYADGTMFSAQESNNFLLNKCVFEMQDAPSHCVLNVDSL